MRHPALGVFSQVTVAALLAAGAAAVAPQQPSQTTPQDPQRPTFRTEANFVRVDVYPTSGGKPLLDLRKEEFEVLEDGRPQAIETFEHVRISAGGPQSERADPGSIEAMRQAAANPRSRIFVIFLDAPHVTADGARNIGQALIRFLDRSLAPDDLVGVMTPWMSPADVVLARKTLVIENGLRDASWGRRFTTDEDQREQIYKSCYRVLQQELEQGKFVSDLARILTVRRREVLTLEALRDLVLHLRDVREERKAIIAVTEGWALYRPDDRITRLREECTCPRGMTRGDLQDCGGCEPYPPFSPWKEAVPGVEPIRVGPDGRLTTGSIDTPAGPVAVNDCSADRMRFANIDNFQFAQDLANDANRANATFYTVDPRGLAAFDMPIYRDMDEVGLAPNVIQDQDSLRRRHDAMANLASGTDGIAVMNSNDLDAGLRRIADDLSSYYLLGYYSTNSKLDGRFRTISGSREASGGRDSRAPWISGADGSRSRGRADRGGPARNCDGGERGRVGGRRADPRAAGRAIPPARDPGAERGRRPRHHGVGRGRIASVAAGMGARRDRRARHHGRRGLGRRPGDAEAGRTGLPHADSGSGRGRIFDRCPRASHEPRSRGDSLCRNDSARYLAGSAAPTAALPSWTLDGEPSSAGGRFPVQPERESAPGVANARRDEAGSRAPARQERPGAQGAGHDRRAHRHGHRPAMAHGRRDARGARRGRVRDRGQRAGCRGADAEQKVLTAIRVTR